MSIIGKSKTDPNKMLPFAYPWAREYYKIGIANNWVPEEISMIDDVEQWKSDSLTPDERQLILWNLGFFSTAESLTANNIVLAVYKHITDPGCRAYLLRQAYEEALHSDVFVYCCDTLNLDPEDIYTMYKTIPSIKEKDDFVVELTKNIFNNDFEINTDGDVRTFLLDLIGYYVIMEGLFFYAGFAMILALKRQKKMTGVGEQFELILRDEGVHLAFGCDLINTIKIERPQIWTDSFYDNIYSLISRAIDLESTYAYNACPNGLLGINAEEFVNYVKYIADKRLERMGMRKLYKSPNPFPWLSQSTDLVKEKNFFETRVTDYQSGTLIWDD